MVHLTSTHVVVCGYRPAELAIFNDLVGSRFKDILLTQSNPIEILVFEPLSAFENENDSNYLLVNDLRPKIVKLRFLVEWTKLLFGQHVTYSSDLLSK